MPRGFEAAVPRLKLDGPGWLRLAATIPRVSVIPIINEKITTDFRALKPLKMKILLVRLRHCILRANYPESRYNVTLG